MRNLVFLILLVAFSCEEPPAAPRGGSAAQSVCDCSAELLRLNKAAAQDTVINFEAIQAEYNKALSCVHALHLKPEEMAELEKALASKCPELAAEQELLGELLGK